MTVSRRFIDPELEAAASALPTVDRSDVWETRRISSERVAAALRSAPPAEDVTVEVRDVNALDGHRIPTRIYRPTHRRSRGVILHVHGGGFIAGEVDMSRPINVEFARQVGAVVVAVDYRLAPEWPYPTPLEDVYATLAWIHTHAAELDIDPGLVAVHGHSAGAGLAAGAALLARDRSGPAIRCLLLVSPTVDDRVATPSAMEFTETPALTRRDVELCWQAYLGTLSAGSAEVPAYAAPARASDLSGLPPTYVSAAELDPLRDEAIEFARALLGACVQVELHLFPGTFHGSASALSAQVSRRQLAEEIAVLTHALTPSRTERK